MADEPKRDDPTDFSQFRKPARKVDLATPLLKRLSRHRSSQPLG
jgi:hypothetical protein